MKTLMMWTAPVATLLLGPGGVFADEGTASGPVRIEVSLRQDIAAPVTIPAVPALGGRTLSTVTRPGPSSGYWGGAWRVSVRLPRDWGRLEGRLVHGSFADQASRAYSESPTVLASDSGDSGSSVHDAARRSFEFAYVSLGWSRRLWSRRGWALEGEASFRSAGARRELRDELTGPTLDVYQEFHDARVDKDYEGLHGGLVLSAPLAGAASLEAAVGGYLARVSEQCSGCHPADGSAVGESGYALAGDDQPRTELIPDVTLRLRIPLSRRLELSGGYRWEGLGQDAFGKLESSGGFFTLTVLVGRIGR